MDRKEWYKWTAYFYQPSGHKQANGFSDGWVGHSEDYIYSDNESESESDVSLVDEDEDEDEDLS